MTKKFILSQEDGTGSKVVMRGVMVRWICKWKEVMRIKWLQGVYPL
jgi:hypothetical protein